MSDDFLTWWSRLPLEIKCTFQSEAQAMAAWLKLKEGK